MVLLSLLLAACSAAGNKDSPKEKPAEPRNLRVERIFSGAPGQGPQSPRVVVAPSASALSKELGAGIPDSGEGIYLMSYWGEKPTGGYSLAVESARLEGNLATVRLKLKEPPPDAMVTQALTYPYAAAVVRDVGLGGKEFSFEDQNGRRLDWPVRRVSD
ncbi:MAG TPA: protease complex subunit PrcB family protein [Rubrobacter sp.]|nr:protease complex subunit PrcB family protein [Rubrobacter sp.]